MTHEERHQAALNEGSEVLRPTARLSAPPQSSIGNCKSARSFSHQGERAMHHRGYGIVEAPSILGLKPTGVELLA